VTAWYHATYYGRLPNIAKNGLSPRFGGSGAIGQAGHRGHSKGKIFFTNEDGALDWFYKAEYIADVQLGPYQNNVPVLLRFYDDALPSDPVVDPAGEYPAWFVDDPIEAAFIKVFDGNEWIPVEDWVQVDPTLALSLPNPPEPDDYDSEEEFLQAWASFDDEDDEFREYGGFLNTSPLFPKELL